MNPLNPYFLVDVFVNFSARPQSANGKRFGGFMKKFETVKQRRIFFCRFTLGLEK